MGLPGCGRSNEQIEFPGFGELQYRRVVDRIWGSVSSTTGGVRWTRSLERLLGMAAPQGRRYSTMVG